MDQRGRTVLAMDCALAGAEGHRARPLNRIVSLQQNSARMPNIMRIRGLEVPVGGMVLSFRHMPEEAEPSSSIDIWRETEDEGLGGVALNGLGIRNVTNLEALQGKRFTFDDETEEDAEIRESVFVQPNNDESLEIWSVTVAFGAIRGDDIAVEITANCFDSETTDIPVEIVGTARILREC